MNKLLLVTALAIACASNESSKTPTTDARASGVKPSAAHGWYEDDWAGAIREAKTRNVPVFVDVWATWCHTCRSMKTFVLEDKSMPSDRFVWLALDVDKTVNAEPSSKLRTSVFPTYYVVDPSNESVAGMWVGGASIQQMRAFMADGERSFRNANVALPETDPLHWLVIADRASILADPAAAAIAYDKALSIAPADWNRRADVLSLRVGALASAKSWGPCVDAALASARLAGHTSSATDLTFTALDPCADNLPKDDPRLATLRTLARSVGHDVASDTDAPLSADDRGDAYKLIWEAAEQMGDHASALLAAKQREVVLETAAARAPDAWTSSLYDGTRMETLLFLDHAEEARAMLVDHEAKLPDDFNPPHRLARVLVTMKRYDEGLAAARRALALAYGPRKALVYVVLVDALVGKGDIEGAKVALDLDLAYLRSLPPGQAKPSSIAAAEKRKATLVAK